TTPNPHTTKRKAKKKTQTMRREPACLRVSDVPGSNESSGGIGLSRVSQLLPIGGPRSAHHPERLSSAHSEAIHYFAGSALDKSTVSLSGMLPAGTPFFCKRNAMISTDVLAETEPGADIGIVVCTSEQ